MITKVDEVMLSLNLDSSKLKDLIKLADLMSNGQVPVPKELRGRVVNRKTGFYWSRMEAYIAKYKFKVDFLKLAGCLSGISSPAGYYVRVVVNSSLTLKRYLFICNGHGFVISVSITDKGLDRLYGLGLLGNE